MRLKFTRLTTICLTLGGIMAYAGLTSYQTGYAGGTLSGCASGSTCHGGAASSATILTITGIPSTGWVPGNAYVLTATVTNNTKVGAGFDIACTVGTFGNAPANTTLSSSTEIHHTAPKSMTAGAASWSFSWTAPATGTNVIFNFAGNAVNLNGQSSGDVWNTVSLPFAAATTTVIAPTIVVGTPTAITNTAATLHATVNANGAATSSITVQYGLTTAYGSTANVTPTSASGTTPTAITASLTGLTHSKVYHYRVVAINSVGTTNSPDATFTTGNLAVSNIAAAGFSMYPNPVKDVLTLDAGTTKNVMNIIVSDISGKSMPAQVSRVGNVYSIQVAGLSNGIYWLRMNDGTQVYRAGFVKQ